MLADLISVPDGDCETLAAVAAVSAAVRGQCGWHVAPEISETISVPGGGGGYLPLPSRRVREVLAVRVGGVAVSDFWVDSDGALWRDGGVWRGRVEVDLIHGYGVCPADLADVVRRGVRNLLDSDGRRVVSERVGDVSTAFSDAPGGVGGASDLEIICRYEIVQAW